MNETLLKAAALIVPLVIAIVFHEVAHGLAARTLGDKTAQEMKRLSLNPLRHVDPIGTVVLPGFLALASLPVFGWAKPVPVNARRLRSPRRDMMLVAAAGPGMNLALGVIGAVLLGLLMRSLAGAQDASLLVGFIGLNLVNFVMLNVFLALFNLLPVPPFDGSHILEGMLPREAAIKFASMRRQGFALVLILLVGIPALIPSFDIVGWLVWPPVKWLIDHYMALALVIGQG